MFFQYSKSLYSLSIKPSCKVKIAENGNYNKTDQAIDLKVGKKMMSIGSIIAHQYREGIREKDHACPMSDVHAYCNYDTCEANSDIDKHILQPEAEPKMNGYDSQWWNKWPENISSNARRYRIVEIGRGIVEKVKITLP